MLRLLIPLLTCLAGFAGLSGLASGQALAPSKEQPGPMAREFRAAWIATAYNIDWPSKQGLSAAAQQAELRRMLDTIARMRMNAVVFQVRPMGDAFYDGLPSRYWSAQLTGGPAEQAAAREELAAGGVDAWPVLRDLSDSTTDSELQIVLLELIGECGAPAAEAEETLLGALQSDDPHVQGVALAAIPKAGIPAEVAVPELKKHLTSPNSVVASRALSE